ncbi:hypothetical protein, partial [Streptomyces lydicus]|uniref:hypothetical protein n=1 Tax=Streptomyces lydicus TaxID=47763 RepID=UPI003448F25D
MHWGGLRGPLQNLLPAVADRGGVEGLPVRAADEDPSTERPAPLKTSFLMVLVVVEQCMADLVERLVPDELWVLFR